MTTELDAAYLAGLIDGEGAIQISVTKTNGQTAKHRLTVTLATVDIEAMQELAALWGRNALLMPERHGVRSHVRIQWQSASAVELLRRIQPYIRLKRKHVELALSFADLLNTPENRSKAVTPERWEARDQVRRALAEIQVKRPRRLDAEAAPIERIVREKPVHALTCQNCQQSFDDTDLRAKYCSKHCQKQAQYNRAVARGGYNLTCPRCGKAFTSHIKTRTYCSVACGAQVSSMARPKSYFVGSQH